MIQVHYTHTKGRGVFTDKRFGAGETIERAPVILIPHSQGPLIDQTILADYPFLWDENHLALAMGYGSFYNHSYTPNANYDLNYQDLTIDITALRDIEPGEEITLNYNGWLDDLSPMWFEVET